MTDIDLLDSLSDTYVLALTLFGEARGEAVEGRIAVGCVVRNRVERSGRFPDTYRGVCLQKWQFSCWLPNDPNRPVLMAAARLLAKRDRMVPLMRECLWVAEGIVSGVLLDRVKGCDHYMTKALFDKAPPAWAKGKTPALSVGSHVFFTGIA